MITTNDVAKVYDTVLSIPGMSELVKIDLKISRKEVLLLSHVISLGINQKEPPSDLLKSIAPEELLGMQNIARDCLEKAGLITLNEKLTSLREDSK